MPLILAHRGHEAEDIASSTRLQSSASSLSAQIEIIHHANVSISDFDTMEVA